MEDRRVFARVDTKLPVRFLDPSSGREGRAETSDISANGLALITDGHLPVKTPLEMWLDIPDKHEPLYTRGEVVWSDCPTEKSKGCAGVRLEKAELMGLARVLWAQRRQR